MEARRECGTPSGSGSSYDHNPERLFLDIVAKLSSLSCLETLLLPLFLLRLAHQSLRIEDADSTEEIVRQVASTRREKLVQVGLSYDLAHAKGLLIADPVLLHLFLDIVAKLSSLSCLETLLLPLFLLRPKKLSVRLPRREERN
jgi:hypothetical protein